jgi:CRP-like cAMP-binding protein
VVTETFNLSTLRALDLFAPLSDEQLELLRPAINIHHASVGDVLMKEGTAGDELFIILLGECKVIKGHRTVDETVVARLRQKAVFGSMALLAGKPRSASVLATDTCRLLTLSREGLYSMLLENPRACLALLKAAHERVSNLTEQVAKLHAAARNTGTYPAIID